MRGAWSLVVPVVVAACSSAAPAVDPLPASTITHDSPVEPAAPASGTGAAAAPRVIAPVAKSAGGPVLRAPRVVPITFDGDPMRATVESLLASLPGSAYWAATTSEYGVGDVTIAPPIHVATPPPTLVDDDRIASWIADRAAPLDPSAVYLVVYPAATSVVVDGFVSCDAFVGYHAAADVSGATLSYAVVARCDARQGLSGADLLTVAVTHELLEASTDPLPTSRPAWNDVDDPHAIWALLLGGELGDLCDVRAATPADVPFAVQRGWSNEAAAAGHDPCVPAPPEPYFRAALDAPDDARLFDRATRGVRVPLGETRTVDVVLACDASPCDPWDVAAIDLSSRPGAPPNLVLALDRAHGASGDVLHLSITALGSEPAVGGGAFALVSSRGARTNVSFAFVDERPW